MIDKKEESANTPDSTHLAKMCHHLEEKRIEVISFSLSKSIVIMVLFNIVIIACTRMLTYGNLLSSLFC